ncbi:MAG: hypothetical protein LBG70_01690, partial [Bifidobacteriaceae bacterium]|nr:hypothetical protein [Bifidobacteriaceae bacterium]
MVSQSDAAERLINLVIALSNTARPLTKWQIRQRVAGYDAGGDAAIFDRLFERDKQRLRDQLGIPVETVIDP